MYLRFIIFEEKDIQSPTTKTHNQNKFYDCDSYVKLSFYYHLHKLITLRNAESALNIA